MKGLTERAYMSPSKLKKRSSHATDIQRGRHLQLILKQERPETPVPALPTRATRSHMMIPSLHPRSSILASMCMSLPIDPASRHAGAD